MRFNEILQTLDLHDLNPVTFGYESCSSLHSYGPAVRSYWLLHCVISGKGKFTREGVTHKIRRGEIFVIPPYLETYYEADKTDPWSYIWLGFSTEREIPLCFQKEVIRCPEAEHIFKEMKLCSKRKNGKSEYLLAKLWELISLLSEEGETERGYVEIALQYMKSEYMNPLNISELANRIGIDRSYFSNLFKDQMGISPGKYLNTLRLSNAAELLMIQRVTPTTAAYSCGFQDIYHFSKAFKKHFGLSPRAYQAQYKKRLQSDD